MNRRVVVTGIGLVTPLGVGNDATWDGICNGRSGVTRISKFDPSILKTQIAGQVPGFNPQIFLVETPPSFLHFQVIPDQLP